MWRPRCSRSNVWISDVRKSVGRSLLNRLVRVQGISSLFIVHGEIFLLILKIL